jgi:hypothetical protein
LYAFLPFLPKDDETVMGVLKALAASVPDKYTKTDKQNVYSPKDGSDVSMDAITTTLDAAALKEVAHNLEQNIKGDKKLSLNIQELIEGFTAFTGLDAVTLDDMFARLDEAVSSGDAEDISVSWSVYARDGKYVGMHVACSGVGSDTDYTFVSEFSGNDNYSYTKTDIEGITAGNNVRLSWQGDKLTIEGDMTSGQGAGADAVTQNISGSFEFAKAGGGYTVKGDAAAKADVSGMAEGADTMSFDIGVEADIKIGGGLGTLKETKGWSDIYEKEWGSLEDLFNMFSPSQGIFNFGSLGSSL